MIDLMLLAGTALCAISIAMAIVAVLQTRAPRGAAIIVVRGLVVLFSAARMEPSAVNSQNLLDAWQRLFAGEITFTETAPAAP